MLNVVLGGALACATAEPALRRVYYHPLSIDAEFGYVSRPGAEVHWLLEGNGIGHWSSYGVRRRSLPSPAAASLLAVGDSFTEALTLDDDATYAALLESRTNDVVLNVGKAVMSAADYVYHAPYWKRVLQPRWTIVQLKDADLGPDSWRLEAGKAAFAWRGNDVEVLAPPIDPPVGFKRLLFEPRQSSSLLGYGIYRIAEFRRAAEAEPALFRAGFAAHDTVASPIDVPIERELELIAAAFDGRITFLYLSDFDSRAPLSETAVETRWRRACDARGWSCVSTRSEWPSFAQRRSAPYGYWNTWYNTGHLNAAGHVSAANAIQKELARLKRNAVL